MALHSSGALLARSFGIACGFIYAVVVARLLGPSGYGIVAVAISTATVVATVSSLGANELAVREVAALSARREWANLRRFVSWSARTVLTASIFGACLMAAASFISPPYREALMLGSAAVPLLALLQLTRGLNQGSGKVIAAQLPLDVIRWLVTLTLIVLLAFGSWKVTPGTIILIVVTALAVALAASAAILLRSLRPLRRGAALSNMRENWLSHSVPFLAIALFGIIGTEIGTLLLGWLSGPREAGLYQPVAKLAPLMLLANEAIEAALAPRIVHSWEEQEHDVLQRRASRSALASAFATSALVAIIVIAAPYILGAFGPAFTEYQGLLLWIGIAQILNASTGAAPLLLAMTGDMKSRIGAQFATMIVQVGLGLALIPRFGAPGAVAALVAAILVWSILHWWLALRTTGIDTSLLGVFARPRSVE